MLSAELPITAAFKMGGGAQTGGLQDTNVRGYQLNVTAEVAYKITSSGSIVGELGWRYLPGMERVASVYQQQNVSVALTNPAYYKYSTGQVLRNEMFNTRSQGLQIGVLYSQELPYNLYAFGGLRVNFLNTKEMIFGSELTAGTAPEATNSPTPIVAVTDLGAANEISVTAPGAAVGVGYTFLEVHALELSLTTSSVETARFGK
jgi:hypothetical protein